MEPITVKDDDIVPLINDTGPTFTAALARVKNKPGPVFVGGIAFNCCTAEEMHALIDKMHAVVKALEKDPWWT